MNVKRGYAMDEAIAHWTHFMKQRRDESQRQELKIGFPRSPYLILDDVRSLNNKAQEEKVTQEAWQTAVLDAGRDDRLRVEIVPPGGLAEHATPTKLSHVDTVVGPTAKLKKRRREVLSATVIEPSDDGSVVVADSAVVENDGWRVVAGGEEKVKRFGRVLVRRPVTPVDLLLLGVQPSSHGVGLRPRFRLGQVTHPVLNLTNLNRTDGEMRAVGLSAPAMDKLSLDCSINS
ncbi:hypothetical protein LTR17_022898 [Elasticomyces elasticus]|nr:hypothetical protein LTR17_022898 [Elasticomyces elasticus]